MSGRKPQRAKELGVTDAEYERLLAAQGGGCAICGATPKTRRLHVDHNHATGAVRGLLCHRCNRALPTWVTDRWLAKAARYIRRSDPVVAARDDENYRAGMTMRTTAPGCSRAKRRSKLRGRGAREPLPVLWTPLPRPDLPLVPRPA